MPTIRERINAHLPIVLQFLSTTSLVVIALTAICGSQSLKKISEAHEVRGAARIQKSRMKMMRHNMMKNHQGERSFPKDK
tara:strand:+ start:2406 stop:2645 length:240 start_codon:yes stop_codon:yes gene_type:complete